jgi:hypothetical protein
MPLMNSGIINSITRLHLVGYLSWLKMNSQCLRNLLLIWCSDSVAKYVVQVYNNCSYLFVFILVTVFSVWQTLEHWAVTVQMYWKVLSTAEWDIWMNEQHVKASLRGTRRCDGVAVYKWFTSFKERWQFPVMASRTETNHYL